MTRLMPQPSFRWCKLPSCGHRFYVAIPAECTCPRCGSPIPDATDGWPHVCQHGHFFQHGGDCPTCVEVAQVKAEKRRRKVERREWVDRG